MPRTLAPLDKALGGALTACREAEGLQGQPRRDAAALRARAGAAARAARRPRANAGSPRPFVRAASLAGRKANAMGVERMGFWAEALEGAAVEHAADRTLARRLGVHRAPHAAARERAAQAARGRGRVRGRGQGCRGGARERRGGRRRAAARAHPGDDARQPVHAESHRRHGEGHREAPQAQAHRLRPQGDGEDGHGLVPRSGAGHAAEAEVHRARVPRRRRRRERRWRSSGRGSASIRAAFRSSPPTAWNG